MASSGTQTVPQALRSKLGVCARVWLFVPVSVSVHLCARAGCGCGYAGPTVDACLVAGLTW